MLTADAGERAAMSMAARLAMLLTCVPFVVAKNGMYGTSSFIVLNTNIHVLMVMPSVMVVTCMFNTSDILAIAASVSFQRGNGPRLSRIHNRV